MFIKYQNTKRIYLLGTNNPIDFTGYNKLHISINITGSWDDNYGLLLLIMKTKNRSANWGSKYTAYFPVKKIYNETFDISGVTGEGYVQIAPEWNFQCNGYVYKIWLE